MRGVARGARWRRRVERRGARRRVISAEGLAGEHDEEEERARTRQAGSRGVRHARTRSTLALTLSPTQGACSLPSCTGARLLRKASAESDATPAANKPTALLDSPQSVSSEKRTKDTLVKTRRFNGLRDWIEKRRTGKEKQRRRGNERKGARCARMKGERRVISLSLLETSIEVLCVLVAVESAG